MNKILLFILVVLSLLIIVYIIVKNISLKSYEPDKNISLKSYEPVKNISLKSYEPVKIKQISNHKLMYPFLKNFVNNLKLNISLKDLKIYSSNNLNYEDIFIRKETWLHNNLKTDNIKLFIDCIYDDKLKSNLKDRYFHVTWAAISYYLRNVKKQELLKPLKDIYNKKTKFCDYTFLNKTYRNGIKRYTFFEILNKLKTVEQPKDNSRYSVNMFNQAVELHKPYKFSIAFENDIVDGWVTEKIINSFLAGCIPIYDGTDDIYKYFNRFAFINAKDFDSLEELAKYVIKVDSSPKLYNSYIQQSPTNLKKLIKLFWWEKNLLKY